MLGQLLVFVAALALMLGLTLLMAVGVLGGWAPARRYFKDWSRVMVGTVIVAAIVFLVIWGVIPITE